MNYGAIASSLNNNASTLTGYLNNIRSISFGSVWSGDVYNSLSGNLTTAINKVDAQRKNIISIADALVKLDMYKKNDEQISSLRDKLNLLENTEENAYRIRKLKSSIANLETNNGALKKSISTSLSSVTPVESEFEEIKVDISSLDNYKGYIVDTNDFLQLFQSGVLTKMSDGSSLYDYYTEEEVDRRLNEIKSQYTGRDAAVNCALGLMQMASDVGLKLDYDWGGGHTTVTDVDHVATGTDCSAFASWAINQGAAETFTTRTTQGLINVGTKTTYENAQRGDILVYNTGEEGHVVMIVDNDPETQQFLVAEAAGSSSGVIMRTRTYSSLSGVYQARDLSSIYNN